MGSDRQSKMQWRLAPRPDQDMERRFSELPSVIVSLFWNRGLRSRKDIDGFLSPDYERGVHNPFLFRDMKAACQRVWQALTDGQQVVVYSDYDADGVTAAATLVSTFRDAASRLGRDPQLVRSYIPHREKEGYGLQTKAIKTLLGEGMKLLISVDCGIGSAAEIAVAQAAGCDAIVVDHHQVPETVPDCLILHPSAPGETYPFKSLAAVGVAFKFACGFVAHCREQGIDFPTGYEKWLLDLTAIATVTDVVPLVGENRVLEHFGLIVLNRTRRPGLKHLVREAGLTPGKIDSHSIGFGIGPRINAASRLEHASVAFDCLMASAEVDAVRLAARLNSINQERQRLTDQVAVQALAEVSAKPDRLINLIGGEGWPSGVVGIIAGRLAGETGRPSFVFSQDGDRYVGSGRSIPEFDIMAAVDRVKGRLARYGGHPQACGLTIEGQANFQGFTREMEEYAREVLGGKDLRPVLDLECLVGFDQVSWETVEWLNKFEPFGEGNPKPRFLMAGLEVVSLACVGKDGQHVRLGLRGQGTEEIKAIGFGLAETAMDFPPGSQIDAAVELGVNEWNGRRELQVRLIDLRPAGQAPTQVEAEPARQEAEEKSKVPA